MTLKPWYKPNREKVEPFHPQSRCCCGVVFDHLKNSSEIFFYHDIWKEIDMIITIYFLYVLYAANGIFITIKDSVSHTLIYLWRPATISKLTATNRFFQKALTSLNKHEHCTFQNRNTVQMFLYRCIFEGNRLSSEKFGCYFHFILHVMSDKAAFVSGALLYVQRYRGNRYFSAL